MVAAIKQHVTVGPEGKIEIPRSALLPGTQAEVIVLAESASESQPMTQLEAFRALQQSMKLDRASAEKWAAENQALREWNRPRQCSFE